MPQYAIERLYELTKDKDVYITTEVGQHQMWAAQFFGFDEPNRWMTSGGLGTMGYGLPAAMGIQVAHRDSLVIDIAGDASVLMTMQEISTAVQYNLPIKIFILNNNIWAWCASGSNCCTAIVCRRATWNRSPISSSWLRPMALSASGRRSPASWTRKIEEMIACDRPVIFDCRVANLANCFPMIPSGEAHNNMLMGDDVSDEEVENAIGEDGKVLV